MASCTQTGVIVIVEDPSIRRLVKSVLGRDGHQVVECGAEQAMRYVAGGEPAVKLLITNRPQEFSELDADVPILYLTSTPDWDVARRARQVRVLQKPFHAKDLLEAVGDLTGHC